VLDSYFNLTHKSNLIVRLLYDLIRFFDQLEVAYFFGPPCMHFNAKHKTPGRHKTVQQTLDL